MPCGAPAYTFRTAFRINLDDSIAEAPIGTIWSSSLRTEEAWLLGELLRVQGVLFLLRAREDAAHMAEDCFRQALDSARRQDAVSFELRAATSLANLWRKQNRNADARALLEPIYDRFTEGFDTTDLKTAKALLEALR
jgi:predicted ATPase